MKAANPLRMAGAELSAQSHGSKRILGPKANFPGGVLATSLPLSPNDVHVGAFGAWYYALPFSVF